MIEELALPAYPEEWIADFPIPTWECHFMSRVFSAAMRSPDEQTKQGAVIVDWDTKVPIGDGYNGHVRHAKTKLATMRAGSAKKRFLGDDGKLYRRGMTVPEGVMAVMIYPRLQDIEQPGDDLFNLDLDGEYLTRGVDARAMPRELYVQGNPDKYKVICHCETNAMLNGRLASDNAVLFVPMPSCDNCATLMLNNPWVKIRRVVYFEPRDYAKTLYEARPDVILEQYDEDKYGDPAELLIQTARYIKLRRKLGQKLSVDSIRSYR
jgi:deoxycytidylate deaminase